MRNSTQQTGTKFQQLIFWLPGQVKLFPDLVLFHTHRRAHYYFRIIGTCHHSSVHGARPFGERRKSGSVFSRYFWTSCRVIFYERFNCEL